MKRPTDPRAAFIDDLRKLADAHEAGDEMALDAMGDAISRTNLSPDELECLIDDAKRPDFSKEWREYLTMWREENAAAEEWSAARKREHEEAEARREEAEARATAQGTLPL